MRTARCAPDVSLTASPCVPPPPFPSLRVQFAIEAAVRSGANPAVTRGATWVGADNAFWATQVNRRCGWFGGVFYRC